METFHLRKFGHSLLVIGFVAIFLFVNCSLRDLGLGSEPESNDELFIALALYTAVSNQPDAIVEGNVIVFRGANNTNPIGAGSLSFRPGTLTPSGSQKNSPALEEIPNNSLEINLQLGQNTRVTPDSQGFFSTGIKYGSWIVSVSDREGVQRGEFGFNIRNVNGAPSISNRVTNGSIRATYSAKAVGSGNITSQDEETEDGDGEPTPEQNV
ncbi:MAG: hypothetical protein JJT78_03700 [Leptospira sp.]|nr:hypothetical protein [Leptospira sp.]